MFKFDTSRRPAANSNGSYMEKAVRDRLFLEYRMFFQTGFYLYNPVKQKPF